MMETLRKSDVIVRRQKSCDKSGRYLSFIYVTCMCMHG